jgi:hypothetical protein
MEVSRETASFQVGVHQVNQVFGKFGGDTLLGPVGKMEPDMIFQHFAHQAVDAAAHGSQQHKLVATVLIGQQCPLHGVQLAAQLAHPLHHFDFFSFVFRHGTPPEANTLPPYGFY